MKRQYWTDKEVAQLVALYPDAKTENVAMNLGRPIRAVYHKAWSLGLRKSEAYLSGPESTQIRKGDNRGGATRFQKGHATWNKGIHFDSGGRSVETRFKPGNKPHTWNPIGHERLTKEGYLQRKMSDTGQTRHDYINVHHLVWIEAGNEIPPGHILVFKDGDKTHIELDNLELITRAENMARNTVHNLPKDVADLIQLRGALNRKINARGRHEQHNQ